MIPDKSCRLNSGITEGKQRELVKRNLLMFFFVYREKH